MKTVAKVRYALSTLSILSLSAVSLTAQAEIYLCKDAEGHTITSDRPIPECGDRKISVLGNSGTVKREIAPPITAEQRKQKQEEEAKRKAAEIEAEKQRRQDSALLARYRTEEDLEVARKRTLELLQEQIKRERANLDKKEKNLADTKTETSRAVTDSKQTGKPLPPELMRKLEDSQQAVRISKKMVADKESELEQINAKFDQSLKRLRDLNAAKASAASPSASVSASATASAVTSAAAQAK